MIPFVFFFSVSIFRPHHWEGRSRESWKSPKRTPLFSAFEQRATSKSVGLPHPIEMGLKILLVRGCCGEIRCDGGVGNKSRFVNLFSYFYFKQGLTRVQNNFILVFYWFDEKTEPKSFLSDLSSKLLTPQNTCQHEKSMTFWKSL